MVAAGTLGLVRLAGNELAQLRELGDRALVLAVLATLAVRGEITLVHGAAPTACYAGKRLRGLRGPEQVEIQVEVERALGRATQSRHLAEPADPRRRAGRLVLALSSWHRRCNTWW